MSDEINPAAADTVPAEDNQTPAAVEPSPGATPPEGTLLDDSGSAEKPEGTLLDDSGSAEKPAEKPAEEPKYKAEDYDLGLPEGVVLDEGRVNGFKDMCVANNLSPEQVKALVAYHLKDLGNEEQRLAAQRVSEHESYCAEIRARPDFEVQRADAIRGRQVFANHPYGELLSNPMFADNPLIFDLLREVGASRREDAPPSGATDGAPASFLDSMYPTMRQK